MTRKTYTARKIIEIARCTSAQLNYYHQIRLLLPRCVSPEGDHEYDDLNLLRLQQIRIGRGAGLALEEIRRLLDDSDCKLPALLAGARRARPENDAPPARPLYTETEAKVATDADRAAFQDEARRLYAALSALRCSRASVDAACFELWVDAHRHHIERWFCPCEATSHLAFARAIAKNAHLAADIERHGRELTAFMLSVIENHAP